MSVCDDQRVTAKGREYWVRISHGEYLVVEDDHGNPPRWWVFDESELRVAAVGSTDPLRTVGSVTAAHSSAEAAITAVLACDGVAVTR